MKISFGKDICIKYDVTFNFLSYTMYDETCLIYRAVLNTLFYAENKRRGKLNIA